MARVENGIVYTPEDLAMVAAGKLYECENIARGYSAYTVWDPCCGDGALLKACKRIDSAAICHGIDLDKDACKKARESKLFCYPDDLFDFDPPQSLGKLICNPPYVGCKNIRRIVGEDRFKWLKKTYPAERSASCDLAGYVLRHVLQAWRPVVSTWIVTNTIAQGATRRVGLKWAVENGYKVVSVLANIKWPGQASVTVHVATLLDERVLPWPRDGVEYVREYKL